MTREEFRDYVDLLRSQDEISYDVYSGLIDGIDTLKQEPCETIKEIPKDYKYDTETEDFLVYRHMYTGHEIHIEKPVPKYALEQEPCDVPGINIRDMISRQAVLDINESHHGQMPNHINHQIWQEIKDLPSVNPQEPKTGHWINVNKGKWNTIPAYKCSECGANADLRDWSGESPFCPWCGAKMVDPQERSGEE